MDKPTRIVVFAKAPYPGFAKTRLIPALGVEGAAALAARLLEVTLAACLASEADKVELSTLPDFQDVRWQGSEPHESIITSSQGPGDLGKRLYHAVSRSIDSGERVLVIGADCPTLSVSILNEAINNLRAADAVMVPATDGGYVLFGLNRYDSRLFSGIPWSSSTVANVTLARCAELEYDVTLLTELRDIDEPEDLASLPAGWLSAEAM